MRKIIQEINVYSIHEIDKRAKDRAYSHYLESYEFFFDHDYFYDIIHRAGFGGIENLNFSLSGGQGDGACFTFSEINLDKLEVSRKNIIKILLPHLSPIFTRENYHYTHENTFSLDFDFYDECLSDKMKSIVEVFLSELTLIYKETQKELYRAINKDYQEQISYENFILYCDSHNVEFLENGIEYLD